jgi:dihydrofolate reductase
MRKIILMMSVSLDGFIEGPGREIDWHMVDARTGSLRLPPTICSTNL